MLTPNRPQKRLDYIAKQFARTPRAVAYAMNAAAWLFDMEQRGPYRKARERIFEAEPGSEDFWEAYRETVKLFPAKGENDDIIVWFARELAKAEKAGDNDALESLADRLGRNAAAIAMWRAEERPDLMAMSVAEVEEQLGDFDAARGARPPQGAVVMEFDDGWTWQELEASMLKCEGEHMKHCVGGFDYRAKVADGRSRILSLRDERGYPHVTVEIAQDYGGPLVTQAFGPNDSHLERDSDEWRRTAELFEKLYRDDELKSLDDAMEVLNTGAEELWTLFEYLNDKDYAHGAGGDLHVVWAEDDPIYIMPDNWNQLVQQRLPAVEWEGVLLANRMGAGDLKYAPWGDLDIMWIPLVGIDLSDGKYTDMKIATDEGEKLNLARVTAVGQVRLQGKFSNSNFSRMKAADTILWSFKAKGCNLTNVEIRGKVTYGADFEKCNCAGATISLGGDDVSFTGCDLERAHLTFTGKENGRNHLGRTIPPKVVFSGCALDGTTISDTDLSLFTFSGCSFDERTEFINCTSETDPNIPGWVVGPDGILVRGDEE